MQMTTPLDADCPDCDDGGEVIWWKEDETEDTLEVYVDCRSCGRNFPKKFVDKSGDTSRENLEEIARGQVPG